MSFNKPFLNFAERNQIKEIYDVNNMGIKIKAMTDNEEDFPGRQLLRQRAEAIILKENENTLTSESEIDYTKLLYELKKQQAVLELQNQSLLLAFKNREMILKQYTLWFDLSMAGYFLLELDGTIDELNFKGADLLGEKRFALKGINFKIFVSDESMAVYNDFLLKVYRSNAKQSCEIMLGYEGNSFRHVYMEGTTAGKEFKCLLTVIDLHGLDLSGSSKTFPLKM